MPNIQEHISTVRIIDSHEHVKTASHRKMVQTDLFGLLHYFESDLITAGMERDALTASNEIDLEEKAQIFLKYFERSNNTAYGRSFMTAMKDLYGMTDWTVENVIDLNKRVLNASNDPNWYSTVLNKRSGIDLVITLVDQTKFDDPMFRSIMFMDDYSRVSSVNQIRQVEKMVNRSITTLSQYVASLHEIVDAYVKEGMVGTKLGIAYRRTLAVDKPTFHEAELVFNKVLRSHSLESFGQPETKQLQDYLIHEIIRASIDHNLPIQIHTGHHETSVTRDGNMIVNSKVSDLVPLLLEYPEAKFILLHAGLPYTQEYLSIAKNFANVYADMTWVYIISPTIAVHTLHKMIEMVPQSKIQGFGGDYNYVEGIYAHSKLARNLLSIVLNEKIAEGYFTNSEARRFADLVLRDNLIEIYNLNMEN